MKILAVCNLHLPIWPKSAECTNSSLGYLSTCPLAYSLGFVSPFRSYQRRKLLVALGGRLASDRGYVLRTYRTELLVLKIEDGAVEQLRFIDRIKGHHDGTIVPTNSLCSRVSSSSGPER